MKATSSRTESPVVFGARVGGNGREQERAAMNWATGRDIAVAPVNNAGLLAAESRA